CTNDRAAPDSPSQPVAPALGPDQLLLRVPRAGGTGRVYVYPNLDSVVWTLDESPALQRVLAFDPDAGTIAFVDVKGFPGRIDLRETDVGKASKAKLTSLSSANGTDIYGVNAKGEIVRLNPNGGDRIYVATAAASGISIIDRYTGRVQTGVVLAAPPLDLRMDALGRYLIARFPKSDSAWVVAIGTNRLVGAVQTRWAPDLPAVT